MAEPTLSIPKDVIEPIIQAQIAVAVAAALSDKDDLVRRAVAHSLNVKVDHTGSPSNWGNTTWLQYVMNECLRSAAKAAIVKALDKQRDVIEKQITAELQKKNSPLAKQLIAGMANAMTSADTLKYRMTVSVDGDR